MPTFAEMLQANPAFARQMPGLSGMTQAMPISGQPPMTPSAVPPQGGSGYPLDERGQPVVAPRNVTPGQPQPSRSAMAQYLQGIKSDVAGASLPELAGGAMTFLGAGDALPLPMAGNALNPGSRSLMGRELRSYTERGAAKNAAEDSEILRRQLAEKNQPVADAKDFADLPSHILQEPNRKPNGRFGKIPDEIKAARDKGREQSDLEKRSDAKYPPQYDENGEPMLPAGLLDKAP